MPFRPIMPKMPKLMPQRIVVTSKDVENITGQKPRTARKLLQYIRDCEGKNKRAYVTVREFSFYTGIDEDTVREFLLQ